MTDAQIIEIEDDAAPSFFVLGGDDERTPVGVDGGYFAWLVADMNSFAETRVARTRIGPYLISTVFWGIAEHGPDKLFETMVFSGDPDIKATYERELAVWRCATWDDAERQHQEAIHWLQAQLYMAETWNRLI